MSVTVQKVRRSRGGRRGGCHAPSFSKSGNLDIATGFIQITSLSETGN